MAHGVPEAARPDLWRNLRAAAESGWDFSSRWLGDRQSLSTIRPTRVLPIDLTALLFGLEETIAAEAGALNLPDVALQFDRRARDRKAAIERHLWQGTGGFYADYDLDVSAPVEHPTAAQAFALFTGLASAERAEGVAESLDRLVRPGGLMTTDRVSDQHGTRRTAGPPCNGWPSRAFVPTATPNWRRGSPIAG